MTYGVTANLPQHLGEKENSQISDDLMEMLAEVLHCQLQIGIRYLHISLEFSGID